MTGNNVQQKKKFFGLPRFRSGKALAAVFLVVFFLGYNLTVTEAQQSSAPPAIPDPAATGQPAGNPTSPPLPTGLSGPTGVTSSNCPGGPVCSGSCEPTGTSGSVAGFLIADLYGALSDATVAQENWLFTYISAIVQSEYDQMYWLEQEMEDWWNTMWYYNLLPGLQSMTRQLNVATALQALQLQENADVSGMQAADRELARHGITDQQMLSPEEQVCVAATGGGGLTRSSAFIRAMRHAWEANALMSGLNTTVDANGNPNPSATSAAGSDQQRYRDWQNIFCDPLGNSLSAVPCGTTIDTNLTNADVLPVKYLFSALTIPLGTANVNGDSAQVELGIEYLINNLVGLPAMDAITQTALATPAGQEGYLTRRSYLARYAAIRSVPDMVAGWRVPGSQMGQWIQDLRGTDAGVAAASPSPNPSYAASASPNPSYKEVMHALSVDRFNSGQYATEMITDPAKVEQEKLEISAFYLMQLRDYYELLERTALTLAVQVSLMDDQQSMANANVAAPTQ